MIGTGVLHERIRNAVDSFHGQTGLQGGKIGAKNAAGILLQTGGKIARIFLDVGAISGATGKKSNSFMHIRNPRDNAV